MIKGSKTKPKGAKATLFAISLALAISTTVRATSIQIPFRYLKLDSTTNEYGLVGPFFALNNKESISLTFDFNSKTTFFGAETINGTGGGDWGITGCVVTNGCLAGESADITVNNQQYNATPAELPFWLKKKQKIDKQQATMNVQLITEDMTNSPYNQGYGELALGPGSEVWGYLNKTIGTKEGSLIALLQMLPKGNLQSVVKASNGVFNTSYINFGPGRGVLNTQPAYVLANNGISWLFDTMRFGVYQPSLKRSNASITGGACLDPEGDYFLNIADQNDFTEMTQAINYRLCGKETCDEVVPVNNSMRLLNVSIIFRDGAERVNKSWVVPPTHFVYADKETPAMNVLIQNSADLFSPGQKCENSKFAIGKYFLRVFTIQLWVSAESEGMTGSYSVAYQPNGPGFDFMIIVWILLGLLGVGVIIALAVFINSKLKNRERKTNRKSKGGLTDEDDEEDQYYGVSSGNRNNQYYARDEDEEDEKDPEPGNDYYSQFKGY